MRLLWLLIAALATGMAWGQAPSYTANNIVDASDFTGGPFAPNSVLSLFGSNLSWKTHALQSQDIVSNTLPTTFSETGVQVIVDYWPAPLLYVSGTQINFLIPGNLATGDVTLRVVRQGVTGPPVTVTLVDSAPAVFDPGSGYMIAAHADGSLLTTAAPAHPGEIVVIYATGMGKTEPNPSPGAIPLTAAAMLWLSNLTVYLDGRPLPSFRVKYAGVTPYSAGLYQINLELPLETGADPQIRLQVGSFGSPNGLQIPVR